MGKIMLGRLMFWIPIFPGFLLPIIALVIFTRQPIIALFCLATWAGSMYLGWKWMHTKPKVATIPVPAVPNGFHATFWHHNIALDQPAGLLWLRDHSGFTKTFQRVEIRWWQAGSRKFGPEFNVVGGGGQAMVFKAPQVDLQNQLLVQTTDLEHPLYAIDFGVYGMMVSSQLNRQDALDWANRLSAWLS